MTDPTPPRAPEPGTHCEWCGADFERQDPARARRAGAPAATAPPPQAAEPAAHCEWCGAEYPAPGDGDTE